MMKLSFVPTCRCLALVPLTVLAFLGAALPVRSQTLVVVSGGQTRAQGDTVSINTIPNMPNLVLSVSGGTSCDTFSYQINVSYTDQAQFLTEVSYGASNLPADQPSTVDWLGVLQGGSATITWTFDSVQQASFEFFINGMNPSNSAVDAYLASGNAPWFAQNLVAEESGAYKYAPYNQYHQFDSNGYPLWGTPDGIGLMQVEPPNRLNGGQDFWAWSLDIADGLHLLSNILATNGPSTGPYGNWTVELGDMINNTGGNPVPASWPSDCQTHANGAVCGGFGSAPVFYCSFSSGNPNGSQSGFGDGNWMHAYNGSFFASWVDGTTQNPGHWEYDALGPSNGYVYNVCTTRPL